LDQSSINKPVDTLPANSAIIQLVGGKVTKPQNLASLVQSENEGFYFTTMKFVEDLAVYLKNASVSSQGKQSRMYFSKTARSSVDFTSLVFLPVPE
jgi:hypothetical protein